MSLPGIQKLGAWRSISRMIKKIFFLILSAVLLLPTLALAQLEQYAPGAPQVGSLKELVHSIELATGFIFGFIAVICFVVSGILFLTAQGQPEKLSTARSSLIWGFVGVVVGIVAFSIIAIVGSFIT